MADAFSAESRLWAETPTNPLLRVADLSRPAGLIRLSVGVEPAADLITDIDHALEVL